MTSQASKANEQKAVEQVATPRCDSLNLDDHRFNDIREWRKLAHDCERELTAANAERDAIVDATCEAGCSVGDLTIDGVMKIRVKNLRAEAAESLVSAAPPEGMVEVPVEPTFEMKQAGGVAGKKADNTQVYWEALADRIYKAMIAARPVAAPLREALAEHQKLINQAQDILARHLPPDGTSEHNTINALLSLLDGPQWRQARDNALRALSAAPNNAAQQGDFAAAQNERPDRASGAKGGNDD